MEPLAKMLSLYLVKRLVRGLKMGGRVIKIWGKCSGSDLQRHEDFNKLAVE